LDPTRRKERALEAAEKEGRRAFPDSTMYMLPPQPRDPPGLYIL
jgi:hypothetical protein